MTTSSQQEQLAQTNERRVGGVEVAGGSLGDYAAVTSRELRLERLECTWRNVATLGLFLTDDYSFRAEKRADPQRNSHRCATKRFDVWDRKPSLASIQPVQHRHEIALGFVGLADLGNVLGELVLLAESGHQLSDRVD